MYFDSFQAFLMMGKHTAYVWSAFGISVVSIIFIHLYTKYRHKKLQALLDRYKEEMKKT